MNTGNFFAELKRRNVYKVAVAYAVVGWLVVQISSTVLPTFHAPEWVVQTLIVIVALGFPIALVLAWAFELTPGGLKRTEDVAVPKQARRPQAWRYVVVLGAALSIGLFLLGRYSARNNLPSQHTDAATSSSTPDKSIAVLPFENLSDDKNAAYFADGIQDEILTKLASISELKVISRTSTARYKSKPEDLKTVSQQLAVATILEGSVQKSADKVRVNVQLIDARSDSHLWARSYDGDVKDIFGMETEVSQQVADALRARLSPAEAKRLAGGPTGNIEAYDSFLKGEFEERAAESTLTADAFERAAQFYRQALALDPNFALARARLVMNRMQRHWYIDHLTATQLQPIQEDAERALQLAPDLPEIHIARGVVYYFGHRQYEEALNEFSAAIRLQPNNARALEFNGYVYRRLGRWQDSLTELKKSLEQDPRNSTILAEIAVSYGYLRMWKEAEELAHRALDINPHEQTAVSALVSVALCRKGDVKEARRLLGGVPADNLLITDIAHSGIDGLVGYRAFTSLVEHDVPGALKAFADENTAVDERLRFAARVVILLVGGDKPGARREAEKGLRPVEVRLRERPEDLDALVQASWLYFGLDRTDEAVDMATRAANLLPSEKDALVGPVTLLNLAQIKCRSGKSAEAVDILRRLLSVAAGSQASISSLRINPMWDPIRNDSAFQQLLTTQERVGP